MNKETEAKLVAAVLSGQIVAVGEYRGTNATPAKFMDVKSGRTIEYLRVEHKLEIGGVGDIPMKQITARVRQPEGMTLEMFNAVPNPFKRGSRYAFFLSGIAEEKGNVTATLAQAAPVPVD